LVGLVPTDRSWWDWHLPTGLGGTGTYRQVLVGLVPTDRSWWDWYLLTEILQFSLNLDPDNVVAL